MRIILNEQEELRQRLEKSFERLHDKKYQLHIEDSRDSGGWPGDWEGRTLLGLIQLSQVLGKRPLYLDEILDFLFAATKDRGYFGADVVPGKADEQQLSGNSWFLRSLCELYLWTGDARALDTIKLLVKNLLLPATGKYDEYPSQAEQRVFAGNASGEIIKGEINGWQTSSDIGCAFIMLDGATQAFEILIQAQEKELTKELENLITEMILNYQKLDFIGISAQTHATLSGLRGILRYARLKNDDALFDFAEKIFVLYKTEGMTENFANYNWFRRPLWTEPCAYVDSFFAALELFGRTKDTAYLDFAHYVYFNAFGFGQRSNGGFGCDVCVGSEDGILSVQNSTYEAFWCCTMRGADGLAGVATHAIDENDGKVYVNFFFSGEYKLEDGSSFFIESHYPQEGKIRIQYTGQTQKTAVLYVPSWAEQVSIVKNGVAVSNEVALQRGDVLDYTFEMPLRKEAPANIHTIKGVFKYMKGPIIYGVDATASAEGQDISEMLQPINTNYKRTEEDIRKSKIRILFEI